MIRRRRLWSPPGPPASRAPPARSPAWCLLTMFTVRARTPRPATPAKPAALLRSARVPKGPARRHRHPAAR
eukprot:8359800-Alexandrium_andersonii.AAC.1